MNFFFILVIEMSLKIINVKIKKTNSQAINKFLLNLS